MSVGTTIGTQPAPSMERAGRNGNWIPWKKGQSGNPAGSSYRQRLYREVIDKQETPERVAQVVAMLFDSATTNQDQVAAGLYLKVVGMLGGDVSDAKIRAAVADGVKELLAQAEEIVAAENRPGSVDVTSEGGGDGQVKSG